MTVQYFKYSEKPDQMSASVTVLDPAIEPAAADGFIHKAERLELIRYALLLGGLFFVFIGLVAISGVAFLFGILAVIAGGIVTLTIPKESKDSRMEFRVGYGPTALEISRAHGLLRAGSLTDNEARDVASILWRTNQAKQNIDSNKPLQRALASVSDQAQSRIEEREQAVVESALQSNRESSEYQWQGYPPTPNGPPTV